MAHIWHSIILYENKQCREMVACNL